MSDFAIVTSCAPTLAGLKTGSLFTEPCTDRAVLEREIPDLLIVYLCETSTEAVKLSFEHQDYTWADEQQCRTLLPDAIIRDFEKNNVFDILRQ